MVKMNDRQADETLVKLAQNGDRNAMDVLLKRHAGLVRSLVHGYFLYGGETEDLIQEGLMGLYNAIGDFKEGNTSFKKFAETCISRRIIDAVKASTRKKNTPLNDGIAMEEGDEWADPALSPEEELVFSDDRRELRQTMSGVLSDFEFKVFTMYVDGMTCSEICEATGKPFKSVDNAVQRSKRKLQQVFKKRS
ncbi:MAG: sigma-70 family RNA polymerase sigma factor [Clostridia bacterium]|nr:sigma-70 family RNA polymerase sigma factor [Clostridia bacterium]